MNFTVEWVETYNYTSNLNSKGRGMELSDLRVFNGYLYAPDDKTSIIFRFVFGWEKIKLFLILDSQTKFLFRGQLNPTEMDCLIKVRKAFLIVFKQKKI